VRWRAAFDFYRQIRARNPSPYMFFIEHGERAIFGASPEFLVRLDGSTARIRPLAGHARARCR
jgi:anthranilate synthase component 1